MNDSNSHDLTDFLGRFWSAFASAEASGDFTNVAPMCADDLVFMSPSEEPYDSLRGLIDAWWTPPPSYQITFDRAELVESDHLAVQRGVASDSFTTDAGETRGHRYNYMAVFGRSSNGWELTHFISNMIG